MRGELLLEVPISSISFLLFQRDGGSGVIRAKYIFSLESPKFTNSPTICKCVTNRGQTDFMEITPEVF